VSTHLVSGNGEFWGIIFQFVSVYFKQRVGVPTKFEWEKKQNPAKAGF
jgi:hypothetical protein